MDYAVLPAGRSLGQVNPNGTLVMGVTAFTGSQTNWQPIRTALSNASTAFVEAETQSLALLALQASYAQLPTGRIALLPLNVAGPAANFAAATGLDKKWDIITESQLVDTNWFNAVRYPLAFHLGNESYVKTVVTNGDGKVLYVWSTLLSGPQGQAIMADAVSWILDATLRPPQPQFNSIQVPDGLHAAINFDARSNVDYVIQYRNSLGGGIWSLLNDCLSAPTNRSIWFTNNIGGTGSRFYRLKVGP